MQPNADIQDIQNHVMPTACVLALSSGFTSYLLFICMYHAGNSCNWLALLALACIGDSLQIITIKSNQIIDINDIIDINEKKCHPFLKAFAPAALLLRLISV